MVPIWAQVFGVHGGVPQTLGIPPPPQVSGAVHVPQLSELPQPSPWVPQFTASSAHVFGTQLDATPHLLGAPPPPHVPASPQLPQLSWPPQPSPAGPQSNPSSAHVFGTHGEPHWLGFPPPPHVWPPGQPPHWVIPPHPLLIAPQPAPADAQVTWVAHDPSPPPESGPVRTTLDTSFFPPPSRERSGPPSRWRPPSTLAPPSPFPKPLVVEAPDPHAATVTEATSPIIQRPCIPSG